MSPDILPSFDVPRPSVPVAGTSRRFPVHRIYCVGRNYAAHIREMGGDPQAEPPVFFLKASDGIVENGASVAYPPRTADFHHEVELVVAIGKGGRDIPAERALEHVYGYAVGNDLTRRDLQAVARSKGQPWDTSKSFEQCAPITAIHPVADVGHIGKGRIWLTVDGRIRQESRLEQMIFTVPQIIAELSAFYLLAPGDLIFTGTPEGVGPVKPGNRIEAGIDGLPVLTTVVV